MKSIVREKYSAQDVAILLGAMNYREFIQRAIQCRAAGNRRFGYSDIARSAGFSARSFPRDVVLGKKNISLKSLPGFIKGLGLTGDIATYFRLLVESSHSTCRSNGVTEQRVSAKLSLVKKRIADKATPLKISSFEKAFAHHLIPLVFAALGNPDRGASLAEIVQRTKLAKNETLDVLKMMISIGVVKKNSDRYSAISHHVDLPGLSANQLYQDYFLYQLERSKLAATAQFSDSTTLHLSSSFSVSSRRLPELREKLRTLLIDYCEDSEIEEGDTIVSLVCSLLR